MKGLLEKSHFGIRNKLGRQNQGWGSEAKFEREGKLRSWSYSLGVGVDSESHGKVKVQGFCWSRDRVI